MDPQTQVEGDTQQAPPVSPEMITTSIQYSLNLILVFTNDNGRTRSRNFSEKEISYSKKPIPKFKITVAFIIYILISMFIGIFVVCFTPRPTIPECQRNLKPTMNGLITSDSLPRSIAFGDFNKDNKLDLVVANNGRDDIGILFNDNNGTFTNQITYSTGTDSSPYSVVVNNFNNDSFLDIAVANYGNNNIAIFLGRGNGTFANYTTISTDDSHPFYISSQDLNNDTKSDLVLINYGTNIISIHLGLGNGTFANKITYFMGYDTIPYSLIIADFDHDKILDLAIANFGTNNIAILYGCGNGSFTIPIIYTTNYRSQRYSITAGDFNNDGELDSVVANYGTNNIGIFLGDGNGNFASMQIYQMEDNARPTAVAVADLNNDNQTDIVVVNSEANNIYIYFGYGNGSFYIITIYETGFRSRPYGVSIGDVNNDKILDIVAVNSVTSQVLLLQGSGNGTFKVEKTFTMGYNFDPYAVAVGDFNKDGWLDVAVANYGGDYVEILLQTC